MTTDTTRNVAHLVPVARDTDAVEVATAAYRRLLDLLDALEPDDWSAPTVCPGWDVAAMVGHLIGAAKAGASLRENVRQQVWATRHAKEHGSDLDAANHRQVLDHAHLAPSERVDALRAVAPAAVRGRARVPALFRRLTVPIAPGGSTAPGMPTRLSVGHLMDAVYTRDVWLHTIDIAHATGRTYVPDHPVDRRIVEDVVREWAGRHERPVVLELTGPAGGRFRQGEGGGRLRLDAIDLCLVLSGRADAGDDDLALDADPDGTADLLGTRVLF